jgi:hypothetical protein
MEFTLLDHNYIKNLKSGNMIINIHHIQFVIQIKDIITY